MLVIAALGLVVAVLGLGVAFAQYVTQPRSASAGVSTINGSVGCLATGDRASMRCPAPGDEPDGGPRDRSEDAAASPAPVLEVRPGPSSGTWALFLSHFQPGSTVRLQVLGPGGQRWGLGNLSTRSVGPDGSAHTEPGSFFWQHVPGEEPTGTYEVRARGLDASGDQVWRSDDFTVQ